MKKSNLRLFGFWALSMCLAACSDDGLTYPPNVADAIPDGEFRVLCLNIADTNLDGVISKEEALAVTKIDCMPNQGYAQTISSLEGLHYFANLEVLSCSSQLLTSLDLSGNSRLRSLNCSFNSLGKLDVSGCMELETLSCSYCELEHLQLPRTRMLKELSCRSNRLASLDVSGCPALKGLTCEENLFTELNVDACPDLVILTCSCNVLSNLSRYVQLWKLSCKGLTCDRLDLSECKNLSELFIHSGRIREIVFGDSASLTSLGLYYVDCTSLDLSGCSQLAYLTLAEMPLTELKLPEEFCLTQLSYLALERLEVKISSDKTPKLEIHDCDRLQRIDVSGRLVVFRCWRCPNLAMLNMDLSQSLENFQCNETALTSLDFSQYDRLYGRLSCGDNRLTTLVLPSSVDSVWCSDNLLEEIDISGCLNLYLHNLSWQPMETLKRIRLRRDQKSATVPEGVELVFVD